MWLQKICLTRIWIFCYIYYVTLSKCSISGCPLAILLLYLLCHAEQMFHIRLPASASMQHRFSSGIDKPLTAAPPRSETRERIKGRRQKKIIMQLVFWITVQKLRNVPGYLYCHFDGKSYLYLANDGTLSDLSLYTIKQSVFPVYNVCKTFFFCDIQIFSFHEPHFLSNLSFKQLKNKRTYNEIYGLTRMIC